MSARFGTIMLIHDLWLTPLSWEPFHRFFGNLGYQVLAPAWSGIEGSIADMRCDPSTLNGIGATDIVERYARVVRGLSESPVIMGHGYGGLITQLLIDQGLGVAGVVIGSIPPKGFPFRSLATSLTLLSSLASPFSRYGTSHLTFGKFWRMFCNTMPESEARRAYETQAIPAPNRSILQAAFASFSPGSATKVSFKNPERAPLLFIGAAEDMVVPVSLGRRVWRKHRASPSLAEYKEFPGRGHYIIAEQGWQEVANHALTWALAQARPAHRRIS